MTDGPPTWDSVYAAPTPPPWDLGHPQPVFARLAEEGMLRGRVLDVGCGTGEHALLAAQHGADAAGVDISPTAVAKARAKAAERGLAARFRVWDALDLGTLGESFDTVIDSGLFHVFDDAARARYVTGLAAVVVPGGNCYLACFSDRQPGTMGPRRIRREELLAAFSDGWSVTDIAATTFAVNRDFEGGLVQAWLATIQRG